MGTRGQAGTWLWGHRDEQGPVDSVNRDLSTGTSRNLGMESQG